MPLPVPFTHPIIPVMCYDPSMPPALPPIIVPQMVQNGIPMAAVELINQLGTRSSNSPARMAGYNLAVMNNFMNEDFRELLQITCQYLVLKYQKGFIRTPFEGLPESIGDVLSLWLSNLVLIHPELKAACPPQVVHAAFQNAPVFINMKTELQAMMNQQTPQQQWQQPQQPQPMQHPQQWQQVPQMQHPQPGNWGPPPNMQPTPQWGQPQQLPAGQWVNNQYGQQVFMPAPQQWQQPQQVVQPPAWNGGSNTSFQYQRPVVGNPQLGGYGQPNCVQASDIAKDAALQSRFMGQLGRYNQPQSFQPEVQTMQPVQQVQPMDHSPRWGQPEPVNHPPSQAVYNQPDATPAPVVQPEPEPFKFKELKIKGGSEMDRQNHSVAYFGEEITYGVKERQEVFTKSADELAKASASPLELPDGVEPEVNDSGVHVSNTLHYDVTEESLLLEAKMKYLETREGESPSPMFRIFGKVASPFVGRKSLSNLSNNLRSVNSLSKLAERMKMKMKDALVGKGGVRSPDDLDTVAYLNYLDAYFTKKVNNILNNCLCANIRVGSFTADVAGLSEYVSQKRGQSIGYAWDECANALFTRYINGFDAALDSAVEVNYKVPDNQCMVLTPTTFSYTFTELTLAELGFEFTDNPVSINKDKAPALYKIAASLSKHKKELEVDTDVDYLVTSDGAKYQLYKNYTATGENFLIAEA